MLVAEEGPHRVEVGVHQRLEEGALLGGGAGRLGHRDIVDCAVAVAGRDEIIGFCDELLEIERFDDYGPNGLQVPGAAEVARIVTGVSANRELLERPSASGAELALVHHGLFWDSEPRALTRADGRRACGSLLGAGLSVAALPPAARRPSRDRQQRAALRGARIRARRRPSREVEGAGDRGHRPKPPTESRPRSWCAGSRSCSAASRSSSTPGRRRSARSASSRAPAHRSSRRRSGSGSTRCSPASRPSTRWPTLARVGIHFIAAGHYATETFGIRRLGELVAERFGVEHEFIDVPNPV